MDFIDIIKTRRSIRRFKRESLDRNLLIEFVEAARCAPCGANIQSLEYVIIDEPHRCAELFQYLAWAGYVKPKRNPEPHYKPVAYIIVLIDNEIKKGAVVDAAAAIENIILAAWSRQVGSCWLGAIDRQKISEFLSLPGKYGVDSVIALGRPAETPVMEDAAGDDIKYYLDKDDTLHVPKRPLKKILHINKF